MRILSIVSCVLLLAAVSMAQAPGSQPTSSSSSTSQEAQQQPGQAPVSPLDEPKKPVDAEPAKAQAQATATFDTTNAAGASDTALGEVRLMTRHTEINGDASRSFR